MQKVLFCVSEGAGASGRQTTGEKCVLTWHEQVGPPLKKIIFGGKAPIKPYDTSTRCVNRAALHALINAVVSSTQTQLQTKDENKLEAKRRRAASCQVKPRTC